MLFAAALLHDVGLVTPADGVDFTRASEQIARDVAEDVGLSTATTNTMRTAVTLHYSPGVTRAQGPVAYLLSAGAGLDVIRLRSWQLPPDIVAAVIAEYPRLGLKREFAAAFRTEAARVHAAESRSCAATAHSTWPLRLPRSAAERSSSAPLRVLTQAPSAGKPGHSAGATSRSRAQAQLVPPVRLCSPPPGSESVMTTKTHTATGRTTVDQPTTQPRPQGAHIGCKRISATARLAAEADIALHVPAGLSLSGR